MGLRRGITTPGEGFGEDSLQGAKDEGSMQLLSKSVAASSALHGQFLFPNFFFLLY